MKFVFIQLTIIYVNPAFFTWPTGINIHSLPLVTARGRAEGGDAGVRHLGGLQVDVRPLPGICRPFFTVVRIKLEGRETDRLIFIAKIDSGNSHSDWDHLLKLHGETCLETTAMRDHLS